MSVSLHLPISFAHQAKHQEAGSPSLIGYSARTTDQSLKIKQRVVAEAKKNPWFFDENLCYEQQATHIISRQSANLCCIAYLLELKASLIAPLLSLPRSLTKVKTISAAPNTSPPKKQAHNCGLHIKVYT